MATHHAMRTRPRLLTVLAALVAAVMLLPAAQAGTASLSVSDDSGGMGTMTHTELYCQRTGTPDSCSDSETSSFYAANYNIGWCTGGTCGGITGATDGTIDMLRTNDAAAWCVAVDQGTATTSCDATFGNTQDLYLGNVAWYSHPIDGWFDGKMKT